MDLNVKLKNIKLLKKILRLVKSFGSWDWKKSSYT